MFKFNRPWMKAFPSKRNPTKKFWICKCNVTVGDVTFPYQIMKESGSTNWIVKTPVVVDRKISNTLLNECIEYFKTTYKK